MDLVYINRDAYLRTRLEKMSRRFPTLPYPYILNVFEKAGPNVLKVGEWLEEYESENSSLKKQIQALPQELQDLILDFCVFSSTADGITHIFDDTRPPLGLQINSSVRTRFAFFYYGNDGGFQFSESRNSTLPSAWRCGRWLESLPRQHAQMIQTLRVQHGTMIPTPHYKSINCSGLRKFRELERIVRKSSWELRAGVLYTGLLYWPPVGMGLDRTMWYNVTYRPHGSVTIRWL
ncbi:hypothetical protein DOTSEDRAFT_27634 [Dothistroma septosporum NZE10]|uniref:Uncharacterized protein n=1 Tax=Dothistroma septosporum (strain NZE10 / CBS 128990) TaxID=675120 RepID=N1PIA8_DOTSN|nr:hypothetical protein DOTSEDRAFT_27634 [Dothistroma septosporum NZE10]